MVASSTTHCCLDSAGMAHCDDGNAFCLLSATMASKAIVEKRGSKRHLSSNTGSRANAPAEYWTCKASSSSVIVHSAVLFRESVYMGETDLSREEVHQVWAAVRCTHQVVCTWAGNSSAWAIKSWLVRALFVAV
jgi:hypothetical protein